MNLALQENLAIAIEKKDNRQTISLLNQIGKIQDYQADELFLNCINSDNKKVRLLWVKNLSKIASEKHLAVLESLIWDDNSSDVQKEATSWIWRMRAKSNIKILLKILSHQNPEIVLQWIRWLLVFKWDKTVDNVLMNLKDHENEIIQMVIEKEYFSNWVEAKHPHTFVDKKIENTVVNWDVLKVLNKVEDDSFHLTFTSPPYYNARDYSIYSSYKQYLLFLEKVFKKIHSKTKEWRFLIVNTSPIIIPRVWRNYSSKRYPIPFDLHTILVNMWRDFIDDIIWIKPEASVKNRIGWFQQHRKPLAYKPNPRSEMIMVYRKKTTKLLDRNMRQYEKDIVERSKILWEFDTSNIWEIDPTFDRTHSAVFPIELCNKVIDYYSYKWDLVFDPFAWSWTLWKSALQKGRKIFLTEVDKDYYNRIKENLWWFDWVSYKKLK